MNCPTRLHRYLLSLVFVSCSREPLPTPDPTPEATAAAAPRSTSPTRRSYPTSWIVNGSDQNWSYAVNGNASTSLPAYAVKPLGLGQGPHKIAVTTPEGTNTYSLTHEKGRHTLLNPGGQATFIMRSITYSTSGVPQGGRDRRREVRDELVQRPFAFGLNEPVPSVVNLNLNRGTQQQLNKIYLAFPDPMTLAAAKQILAGGRAMYMGTIADVCRFLGEQDSAEARDLLRRYAFEEQEPQAAYALFQEGEVGLLTERFGDLSDFTAKGISSLMASASRKTNAISDEHLPLLEQGLRHPEIKVRREYLKPGILYLPADHPLMQLAREQVAQEPDPKIRQNLNGLLERREARVLKEADYDELLGYFTSATDIERRHRILRQGAWLPKKPERLTYYTAAGEVLAATPDTEAQDALYARIQEEALTPAWRPDYLDAFTRGCTSGPESAFRTRVMRNRIEWGLLDQESVNQVRKTAPELLQNPSKETLQGIQRLLRSDKQKTWLIGLIDQMNPGEERDNLIKTLGYSLPYRVPITEILSETLNAHDPELRRSLYERCRPIVKSNLKKGKNSQELRALIEKERDPALRQILLGETHPM